jgi:putative DNA primase/helicase
MNLPEQLERGDASEVAGLAIGLAGDAMLKTDLGEVYTYNDALGIWQTGAERDIGLKVVLPMAGRWVMAGRGSVYRVDVGVIESVVKMVRWLTKAEGFFDGAKRGVACKNGFVTLEGLQPHAPENRARWAYPFDYDPEAQAPLFYQLLAGVFQGDLDGLDKMAFFQEFFGGALFGLSTTYQKCVTVPGGGQNGRSTFLEVMEGSFPPGTTCTNPPQQWGGYFLAGLEGKLLNVVTELPKTGILDSKEFKAVIVGDKVQANRKYRDPIEFKPRAGHAMAPQGTIPTNDQSWGFWRRFVLILFNHTFTGAEIDPEIKQKILADENELRGILAWLVGGARRLQAQKGYTIPASHADALASWKVDADSVLAFASEFVSREEVEPKRCRACDVYETYKAWCKGNGLREFASNQFKKRFSRVASVVWHDERKHGAFYTFPLAEDKTITGYGASWQK